jgi:hypothetical protein
MFQTLEKEVQNESVIAAPRVEALSSAITVKKLLD